MGTPTLSSALSLFTAEFGMGSGGTGSLWPPGITGKTKKISLQTCALPQHTLGLYDQVSRAISIG